MTEQTSATEAYSAIMAWYRGNASDIPDPDSEYARKSQAFTAVLPEAAGASSAEMAAVFHEVLSGLLEWAYVRSDGIMSMSDYARAGMGGQSRSLSDAEKDALKGSALAPFLSL